MTVAESDEHVGCFGTLPLLQGWLSFGVSHIKARQQGVAVNVSIVVWSPNRSGMTHCRTLMLF